MRHRPWSLIVLSVIHFLAPFGNIVFNAIIQDQSVVAYFIKAVSPDYLAQNWIILVAPVVAGFSIYACKRWSFFAYLIAISALFIFSYSGFVAKAGHVSIWALLLVYFVNIAVVSYFLLPAVRSIYFDRRMRWWEIQPRYKCNFKCLFTPTRGGETFYGQVGNISVNGLFIRADEMPEDQAELAIELPFNEGISLRFKGRAIIHNRVDAVGFGVQFIHSKESRSAAKDMVRDLEKKGMRISPYKERPEDSFSYWFRQLLSTGKGFFPGGEEKK